MTIFEFAVAREAGRLAQKKRTRELTEKERYLLSILTPTVKYLKAKEENRRSRRDERTI